MRSIVLSASLMAALWLGMPVYGLAQQPEAAPPPGENRRTPPPREVARPRNEAPPRNDAPRSEPIVVREPQSDSGTVQRRDTSADRASRRRPPATAAPAPTAGAAASGEEGAQRRGTVRRPPSDGNSRLGQATRDRAVARSSVPPRERDRDHIYIYPDYWSYGRYYDPYYSNGFHLGYLAYSPWGWTPAFYGYPYGGSGYGGGSYGYQGPGYDVGSLKIKVKPRDAEVYVDGYFAGQVDDFDGFWQALKLDSGGYRIEVRKPGYEPLQFDVHVQPDRTITYRGELRPETKN